MNHLDLPTLALIQLEGLASEEARAHVSACAECRDKAAKLADVMAPPSEVEPPASVLEAIRAKIVTEKVATLEPARPAAWKTFLKSKKPVGIALAACVMAGAWIATHGAFQKSTNETQTCVTNRIGTVSTSESIFREGDKNLDLPLGRATFGNTNERYAQFDDAWKLEDGTLGSGTMRGYAFATRVRGEEIEALRDQLLATGDKSLTIARSGLEHAAVELDGSASLTAAGTLTLNAATVSSAAPNQPPESVPTQSFRLNVRTTPQASHPRPNVGVDSTHTTAARRITTASAQRTKAPELLARTDGANEAPLPLAALACTTVLLSTRARVVYDLTFANPTDRELQGTLMVRLPDGASPCYLATFQGTGAITPTAARDLLPPSLEPRVAFERSISLAGSWKSEAGVVVWGNLREARVTEQAQAKQVYEATVRRRVDPALMEWSGGNNFSTRIYPIAPRGRKRVVFAWDQAPREQDGKVMLALPVPDLVPPACRVDVAADGASWNAATIETAKGPLALGATGDFLRAHVEPTADDEGAFTLAATPRDARVRSGFAETAGVPGSQLHARVLPSIPATTERSTGSAVFLLDTSLSQRQGLAAECGKLLRAVLEKDASIEKFSIVGFDIAARPLTKGFVANTPENRKAALADVESVWLEGATSLEAALHHLEGTLGDHPTIFLLSDGQLTWGTGEPRELERAFPRLFAERWICYQVGDHAVNRPLLDRLARSGGRVVTVASAQDLDAAAVAHRSVPTIIKGIHVEGAEAKDLVVAGDPRALFAGQSLEVGFRTSDDVRKASIVIESETGTEKFPLANAAAHDTAAARAWGELATTRLLDLGDADADQVALALSQAFALANRVASFLILETDAEYKLHAIEPAKLDLAALAKAAAAREPTRAAGAPDARAVDAKARAFLERIADKKTPAWPSRARDDESRRFPRPRWGDKPIPFDVWREAEARFQAWRSREAVRVLSSIVEDAPRDARALRLAGFVLLGHGAWDDAASLFARVRALRPFEPQAWLEEAIALEGQGRASDAALRYEAVLAGKFDGRFDNYAKESARRLYGRLLAQLGDEGRARAGELGLAQPTPKFEQHLFWSIDDCDIDLHVRETTSGEEILYSHRTSPTGGELLWDNTAGLGPEIYLHPNEAPREAWVHYFGSRDVGGAAPAATLLLTFERDVARVDAAVLEGQKDRHVLWTRGR